MDCGFKDEITTLPSAFGDTGVRVSRLFPDSPDGTHALLLHGVHSSANLGHRNKFRHLAEILAARGVTPWLCETGRVSVSREECDEPLAWIEESFGGKTFGEEHDDCLAALNLVLAQKPAKLWIWGFSLGGIIALLLACLPDVHADRLILSGTGLTATPEAESLMMPMPILSTLRSTVAPDMVDHVRAGEVFAFRGTEDAVFTEEACRSLLGSIKIPDERKKFYAIEGADHSLKTRRGKHDPQIMDEMLSLMDKI